MNKKLGFIGCGKMASAIIKGCLGIRGLSVKGSEINPEFASDAQKRLGVPVLTDNKTIVIESDIIVIATKPNQVSNVLEEIKTELTPDKLLVSIAAGVSTQKIENIVGKNRVVRIMPNTPALVKEGMFGVCKGSYAKSEDVEFVVSLLSKIGRCIEITEAQMDIVTAISGSGPAFFYQVIEDMARAGEKLGLDYEKSLTLAAQTALGSGKMIFNRGETSVQNLIDNVATRGGCTFVGIEAMKINNSATMFEDVIYKTAKKASELGK